MSETLSRRAKLGVSCRVKVLVGQGLATHPYRVLVLLRSGESHEQDTGQAYTENLVGRRGDRAP